MKKLTTSEVDKAFAERGWKVLQEYRKSSNPMSVICPNGHNTTISWNNFQKGQGCKFCAGNVNFTYEKVKQYFLDQGCELLDTTYEKSILPLNYKCSCGNISRIDFGNFRLGRRCQKCKGKAISEKLRTTDNNIEKFCIDNECKFIQSWIKSKRTRIEYICKCGEKSEAYWSNFNRFPNCKKCGSQKISGSNCYMYDPDRDAVEMRKRFRKMCGQHIQRFMKATGQKKTKSTHELLGYTPKQLQEHILNHVDYPLCIGREWHVDHIFPIRAFLDHNILDLKLINHLSNLRPMLGKDNLSKADIYDREQFLDWLLNTR